MKNILKTSLLILLFFTTGCGDSTITEIAVPTGIAVSAETAKPTEVPIALNIVEPFRNTLASGTAHTLFISDDGSLWAWGNNSQGQIGDGTNEIKFSPVKVLDDVIAVFAQGNKSMAIQSDGTLWGWGDNSSGLFGDGTTENHNKPFKITENVIHTALTKDVLLMVKADGSLWGIEKPLSDCDKSKKYLPFGLSGVTVNEDYEMVKLIDKGVTYVAASFGGVKVIMDDNTLWGWGVNAEGQLGGIENEPYSNVSELSFIMDNVAYVAPLDSTEECTYVVTTYGELWGWGINYVATITRDYSMIPVKIAEGISVSPSSVQWGTSFITKDNKLIAFGQWNYWNERARTEVYDEEITKQYDIEAMFMPYLIMENVAEVSDSSSHDFIIVRTTDNELWGWGDNSMGQLGIPDVAFVPQEKPVLLMQK